MTRKSKPQPKPLPDRYRSRGLVLAFDRGRGLMVVDVRYHDANGYVVGRPRPPLVVVVPTAAPPWLFQIGAEFVFSYPRTRPGTRADFEGDPEFMADFEPVEYWWCSVEELEKALGIDHVGEPARTPAEVVQGRRAATAARAALDARRPAHYVPAPSGVAAAADRLRPWFPEWVGVARG